MRDIVVVGASAGGVEALKTFAAGLPEDFSGSIFITVHFPEHGTSSLPQILSRAGPLPAMHAVDGDPIVPGRIVIAPPDHHLLITNDGVRLVRGPRENGNRPAADPMFRSAAVAFGPRVIGVVLTGNLDDGTSGLVAIKRHGGLALVQDPDDALFSSMPQSAVAHVNVDCITSASHLAAALGELMAVPVPKTMTVEKAPDAAEVAMSAIDLGIIGEPGRQPGKVSPYSCPDCGGVLREIHEGELVRFRCRVGHAWTGDALSAEQSTVLDDALWTALRALEENVALGRQLAEKHRAAGRVKLAERFARQAIETQQKATVIRRALVAEPTADESSISA